MKYTDIRMIGCLVWLRNTQNEIPQIGILADVYDDPEYPEQKTYYALNGGCYKYCEPAKDTDIVFYADKDCTTAPVRRAKKELIDAIEEILESDMKFYREEYPGYGEYMERAEADKVYLSCLESQIVVDKSKKLMEEM